MPVHIAAPARRPSSRIRAVALPALCALLTLVSGVPGSTASSPKEYRRAGIDVSHYQGRIDWPRVARAGIDFAIIKATDGNQLVDEWYVRNRERARAAGILVTAYHFARPGLAGTGTRTQRIQRDARREARFFVRTAQLRSSDLIPALDLERSGGLGSTELRIWVMAFLRTVRVEIGARPMVYSTAAFWRDHVADTATVARAGFQVLWVAQWGASRPDVPGRQWLGRGWTFWQWTACGRVAGIDDCVDRNTYLSRQPLKSLTIKRQRQG